MTSDTEYLTFLESEADSANNIVFEVEPAQLHQRGLSYTDFLAQKTTVVPSSGIAVQDSDINPKMFPFQRVLTRWADRKGQCAIFADTGMGKTIMQLEWARLMDVRALIVAPLAVARQTVREGQKFGYPVHYTRSGSDLTDGINITNYEMAGQFDAGKFGAVVLDECFPPDTPIDVFSIDKSLELRYISDVREGDTIYNAQGEDHVKAVYKRHVNRAIRLEVGGREVTCSENHPFFTMYGWRCAQDLRPGDYIMETRTAVRLVWQDIHPEIYQPEDAKILQSILLSEMADEYPRTQGQGPQSRSGQETGCCQVAMVQKRQSEGEKGIREDHEAQPDEQSRGTGESIIPLASNEAQTFRAWGQWDRFDGPATDFIGCTRTRLDSGICFVTGPTNSGLSYRLQARLSESRAQDQYRSRRSIALQSEGRGSEAGRKVGFARVDSVEILEQGHPELEKYRNGEGHIYFYDVKAERHPSFSVNGLLVHNSSILKAFNGSTRKQLTEQFRQVPYRLCCTATPAPNDHIELGNHAEFLGICTQAEMKAMFFINANKQHIREMGGVQFQQKGSNAGGTEWRLKHNAEKPFFEWLSQWAMSITKPSDLGFDDDGFVLPPLHVLPHIVESGYIGDGQLLSRGLSGVADRHQVRRSTIPIRLAALQEVIQADDDSQWVIWCGQDAEQDTIADMLADECISIYGSLSPDEKESRLEKWLDGEAKYLVTKPRVCGFGLNLQQAHNMAFFGLNDSWEAWFQCIRREWRYGQKQPVNVHAIISDVEEEIYHNVMRKEALAMRLRAGLMEHVGKLEMKELDMEAKHVPAEARQEASGEGWKLINGDSCEWLHEVPDNSVDLSIYSPPFADLYVYSDSPRDLGNSRNWAQFSEHYSFIASEVLRVTKPGRFAWVHTAEIPAMKERDGYLGLKDFPHEIIRAHEAAGWIYWDRIIVPKNPQPQAIRTHANALLFVTLRKDAAKSRTAIYDHVLCFLKPGENAVPITPVEHGEMSNDIWIDWATGVWMGIRETETLQQTREEKGDDEKHIAPLQLGTIERCLKLKSNPGELILSPFAGIGSEGYQAIKFGRRFIGCELKTSYWELAVRNLREAEAKAHELTLFDLMPGKSSTETAA